MKIRLLSGAAAVLFALAYTGPLVLCGEACAGKAVKMACCGGTPDGGTSAVGHGCCCDITGKSGAIPPSVPAQGSWPDTPNYPATGAEQYADAGMMSTYILAAPVPPSYRPPPIYKQTCTYLC